MRRLTNAQRASLKKLFCLLLSITMFVIALSITPYLARALPELSNTVAQSIADEVLPMESLPVFSLGAGTAAPPVTLPDTSISQNPPSDSQQAQQTQTPPAPNDDSLFVTADNLCWYTREELPALNLIDRTSYGVNLADYISQPFPIQTNITNAPLVLIVHTHGSESYLPNGCNFYSPDEDFRSDSVPETVVHIGDILCQSLNDYGIPTVQDKTMHDLPDYSQSYNNSLKAVNSLLKKYPTVRFVIDLHRDSIFDSQGNNIKPITYIQNKPCAQLMLVVGTNEMGIPHPNWRKNLTFATHLQQKLNDTYPTLMRPINLRTEEFNQAASIGSIILEVGSCGNTVEEAENAVRLFAYGYAALLKENLN